MEFRDGSTKGQATAQTRKRAMSTVPDNAPGKTLPTHVWRNKDSALPCTPSGVEETDQKSGRVYAEVVTPSGDKNFVPKDELRTVAAWKKELKASAKKTSAPPKITAEDAARLDTWMTELAASAHGAGREEASGDWRFGSSDALVLHPNGFWHDFAGADGGCGALSLLAHLHGGEEAGARVAQAWLDEHAGMGRFAPGDAAEDEDATASLLDAENTAYIAALFARAAAGHFEPGGHGLFRRTPIRHRRHRSREPTALAA